MSELTTGSIFSIFTCIITVLALVGVVLNIRQDRRCFYIWTVTNAAWMIVDYGKGLYAQSFMFAVYLCLSIWGLCRWRVKGGVNHG